MREPPVTRREFQKLAELRAEEAGVLVKNRRLQGAYYLAGYAVECALKARIARETKRHEFPPKPKHVHAVYTHNLSELLNLAELNQQLENEIKVNAALGINWGVVKEWSEDSRYVASGLEGKDMHAALSGPNGVLTWIKQRW